MVSKASEDLPEPDTPLTTVSFPWGMSQEMFFRLCVRAPRMTIASFVDSRDEIKLPDRVAPDSIGPDSIRPGSIGLDEFKGRTPK